MDSSDLLGYEKPLFIIYYLFILLKKKKTDKIIMDKIRTKSVVVRQF